ncbi:unnamed protein product [Hydatigera taeniaeformis]|uniref:Uncharacterized protein n=1 Tax=Hydatigena taeniaeformis TaxID=6205 RepID=A0A0R3WUX0_HYDTA|nr:unnamed protein product [Hydatigera taeniaeformis]
MKEEDGPDEDEFASAGSIWRIEEPKSLANKTWVQKTLFAIRFKGRIICKAESCGMSLLVSHSPSLVEPNSPA